MELYIDQYGLEFTERDLSASGGLVLKECAIMPRTLHLLK